MRRRLAAAAVGMAAGLASAASAAPLESRYSKTSGAGCRTVKQDVEASVDLTGAAVLGGDWDLEYQQGRIETSLPFSIDVRQQWDGVLAPNNAPVNSVPGAQSMSDCGRSRSPRTPARKRAPSAP